LEELNKGRNFSKGYFLSPKGKEEGTRNFLNWFLSLGFNFKLAQKKPGISTREFSGLGFREEFFKN